MVLYILIGKYCDMLKSNIFLKHQFVEMHIIIVPWALLEEFCP